MKNPNGYGTVVKLSGNRRRPWAVRKTIGWNEKGHPIYLHIGYTETYQQGLILLAEYNKSPWDINANKTTLEELYKLWLEKKGPKLGASNLRGMKSAYNHIKSLNTMQYNKIRSYHMQETIDNCGCKYSTQSQIKNLWQHLDKFALELDIITKMNSQLLTAAAVDPKHKEVFTEEEIERVWSFADTPNVDLVLFLLYTGMRISEAMELKVDAVDFDNWTLTGGIKTAAGKNRIIPIHSRIKSIVAHRAAQTVSGYLFEENGKRLTMYFVRKAWSDMMAAMDMSHTPHECRHTLRSRLDSAGANKVAIDRIMGHQSQGVGERVYTHKTVEELRLNIELVS